MRRINLIMSSSVMRVVLACSTVAPWFFHQKKILGNQPENYAQSESVMLFGQAISKASYMGILTLIAVMGVFLAVLGIRGIVRQPSA